MPKRKAKKPASRVPAAKAPQSPFEPDLGRAMKLVMELMAIPGKSGEEGKVSAAIVKHLKQAGAKGASIAIDSSHRRSPLGGETGNLILQLPGTHKGPRRLLMAHLDTVPLCVGCKPKRIGSFVKSANSQTGLGADDRGGCAVVLTAALEILRRGLPHPPVTFFWPIQEEVGLYGAHLVKASSLGKPQLAFNWDGGTAAKITIGATGAYRIRIRIDGIASHAGGAPERGVSAITIASLAISKLHQNGYLGDVRKGDHRGTSNVGIIQGGEATNVITPLVNVKAEARSHDPEFRKEILNAIISAFETAATEVKDVSGRMGRVSIESQLDYESFVLKADEPCVLAAEAAAIASGATPERAICNGGLDANWLTAHGIPTVTLGCGQVDVHTVNEQLDVEQFQMACRIGLSLATGTEATQSNT